MSAHRLRRHGWFESVPLHFLSVEVEMFYCFDQNNTGGDFTINDQFAEDVFSEATSEDDANDRAEAYGLYFDGCQDGYDCECCGDRWYRAWKESGKDQPII